MNPAVWRISTTTLLAGCLALVVGCADPGAGASAVDAEQQAEPIVLLVDFGDKQKSFKEIPHKAGMTVLDALAAAEDISPGLTFEQKSSGEMAFVTSIDGVKNEGGGEGARNWIFRVDGAYADKGAGAVELKGGEAVQWSFEVARDP